MGIYSRYFHSKFVCTVIHFFHIKCDKTQIQTVFVFTCKLFDGHFLIINYNYNKHECDKH